MAVSSILNRDHNRFFVNILVSDALIGLMLDLGLLKVILGGVAS